MVNGKATFTLPSSLYNYQALGASTTPYTITASYSGLTNAANGMADYASSTTTVQSVPDGEHGQYQHGAQRVRQRHVHLWGFADLDGHSHRQL